MFLEIKPYQNINLDDVTGFAIYPNQNESGGRTLYVHMRGVEHSFQFSFDDKSDCRFAYRRLQSMLEQNGNKMEDFKDDTYLY